MPSSWVCSQPIPALAGLVHRRCGGHHLKPGARSPGPSSGGPGLRILAPTLQRSRTNTNLARHYLQRSALRRQQPRHRSVLEFLSVSSQVRPSSPPPGLFYRGDNYSDAGGGGLRRKALSPLAKRRAVGQMVQATSISERRACALVGLSRDSWRHPPQRAQHDQATSERIVPLAHERRRFGYPRIGDLLRAEGTAINDKRVYRLYKLADLSVRKRRSKQRLKLERVPLHECQGLNEVWSMDFVSDSLASGRRIKCLTVTDDFSHECVEIAVDHGISGAYVVRVLDQVARFRGYPQAVRTD